MIDIATLSLGPLCAAAVSAALLLFQLWLFVKRPGFCWTAWGAGISLGAFLYGTASFFQFNLPAGDANRLVELVQYSAFILLTHSLFGFTYAFLGIKNRYYHRCAGPVHLIVLMILWSTDLVIARDFVHRHFLWMDRPYVEPALGPLGMPILLYTLLSCFAVVGYWLSARIRKVSGTGAFLVGFSLWLLFAVHDSLGTLVQGFPTGQFMIGYGVLGFSLAIIAITLQKYIELFDLTAAQTRKLKQSEAKYRLLADNASDLIWIMDLPDGRITYCSPSAERILGYSPAEMTGLSIERLLPAESLETARNLLHEELRKDADPGVDAARTRSLELAQYRKDGRRVWTEITVRFLRDDDGIPNALLGVTRDVSERRAAEADLLRHRSALETKVRERTAELERANRELKREIADRREAEAEKDRLERQLRQAHKMEAVGTLAGGIAHDFNNILAAILGYAELAQYDLPEDNRARDRLDQVIKAGNRARELVRQILTFSRQSDLEKRPLEIVEAMNEALKLLRATLPAAVEIRKAFELESGTVVANATQIHQLVMNLCANAAQAMDGGSGIVQIGLDRCRLETKEEETGPALLPGEYLRIWITDNGCGMPPEILERIFDPYFTTKEVGKGTGMGLAVVHGIVQDLRGRISVNSAPGEGTTFEILLPPADEGRKAARTPIAPLPVGSEHILFVEDEQPLALLGKSFLERLGYRASVQTDPVEALAAFRAEPEAYDLVITDLNMPKMPGDRLAAELMKTRSPIPVILCTGFSESLDEEKARELGIDQMLMKPLTIADLARAVRSALDRLSRDAGPGAEAAAQRRRASA